MPIDYGVGVINRAGPIELELKEVSNEIELSYNIMPPLKDDPNLSKNISLGLIWIGIVSVVIFIVSRNFIDILFFWFLAGVFIIACLKHISPERKGIRVTLGTPEIPESDEVYSGGIYWRWFLLQKFYLFPTEATIIDIPPQDVVTASVEEDLEGRGKKIYAEAKITVNAVIYFFWPNTASGLCNAYKNAPHPDNLEKLHKFFKPYLASKVRKIAGNFSWLRVRVSSDDYEKAMHDGIADDRKGAIRKAGITDFKVENELVTLPKELEDSITAEQVSLLKKAAGKHDAELKKITLMAEGDGVAYTRGQVLKAMKDYPAEAIKLMYEEMAKGESSTIFFELPGEMKDMLEQGANLPDELKAVWDVMPKAQRSHLAKEFLLWLKQKNMK